MIQTYIVDFSFYLKIRDWPWRFSGNDISYTERSQTVGYLVSIRIQ